jgi:hypothetical protein
VEVGEPYDLLYFLTTDIKVILFQFIVAKVTYQTSQSLLSTDSFVTEKNNCKKTYITVLYDIAPQSTFPFKPSVCLLLPTDLTDVALQCGGNWN